MLTSWDLLSCTVHPPLVQANLCHQEDATGITEMTLQAWIIKELQLPPGSVLGPLLWGSKLPCCEDTRATRDDNLRPPAKSRDSCKPCEEPPRRQVRQQPGGHQAWIRIKDRKPEAAGKAASPWDDAYCCLKPQGFGVLCSTETGSKYRQHGEPSSPAWGWWYYQSFL